MAWWSDILFAGAGRVKRDHGVGLEHSKQKDEPAADFRRRDLVHAMRAVVEIEHILEAQARRHLEVFLLVAQDVPGDGTARRTSRRCGADQIAGIALVDELGAEAAGIIGQVLQMGVNGDENLALVGLSRPVLFDDSARGAGSDEYLAKGVDTLRIHLSILRGNGVLDRRIS